MNYKTLITALILTTASQFSYAQDKNIDVKKETPTSQIKKNPQLSLVANKDYIPLNISEQRKISFTKEEIETNKIQIIEFFWYGCPHCYHMEKNVNQLLKDRKDIVFKRYPVSFPRWESGSKLFFTLNEMGIENKLHAKVFEAIQEKHLKIMDDKNARDTFLKAEGVDVAKFNSIYDSFGISTKVNQSKNFLDAYKIESSPVFVVNHAYQVNPGLNGGYEQTMTALNKIVDFEKSKK